MVIDTHQTSSDCAVGQTVRLDPADVSRIAEAVARRLGVDAVGTRWLSIPDAARTLHCSVATVRRLIARGQLVAMRVTAGGRVHIDRDSVDRLLTGVTP